MTNKVGADKGSAGMALYRSAEYSTGVAKGVFKSNTWVVGLIKSKCG